MELGEAMLEREILAYIRFCLESGHYYDSKYPMYLEVADKIIENWRNKHHAG